MTRFQKNPYFLHVGTTDCIDQDFPLRPHLILYNKLVCPAMPCSNWGPDCVEAAESCIPRSITDGENDPVTFRSSSTSA